MSLLLMAFLANVPAYAERIESDAFVACARDALQARAPALAGELELTPVKVEASDINGAGQSRLQAGAIEGAWPRRRVGVPVDVWRDEVRVQTRMVWFSVRWWRDAWVYARDARSGEHAAKIPLRQQRVDLLAGTAISPQPLIAVAEGTRLRQSVRQGQAALVSDFEPVPDVERASEVELRMVASGLRLTTRAIALRDGDVGEWIEVSPAGDAAPVRAKVTARNEVALEY